MSQAVFELPFWRAFLANPLRVASPVPSGPALARAIAAAIDAQAPGGVLELGAGSGAVTAALLARGITPADLIAVEYAPDFCAHLRQRFAGLTVLQGDAFAFPGLTGNRRFKAIVSGLPVMARSPRQRRHFMARVMEALQPGGVFVQFSYSPLSPFPARRDVAASRRTVWANLPPMQVWWYRRA